MPPRWRSPRGSDGRRRPKSRGPERVRAAPPHRRAGGSACAGEPGRARSGCRTAGSRAGCRNERRSRWDARPSRRRGRYPDVHLSHSDCAPWGRGPRGGRPCPGSRGRAARQRRSPGVCPRRKARYRGCRRKGRPQRAPCRRSCRADGPRRRPRNPAAESRGRGSA